MSTLQELISASQPVLIIFSAEWAPTTEPLINEIKELKKVMGDKLSIVKMDAEKNENICSKYDVIAFPSLILFVNGEIKWRSIGMHYRHELQPILKDFV